MTDRSEPALNLRDVERDPILPTEHRALAGIVFGAFIFDGGNSVHDILNDLQSVVLPGDKDVRQFNVNVLAVLANQAAQENVHSLTAVGLHDTAAAVPEA